jgi:hypothetical protein
VIKTIEMIVVEKKGKGTMMDRSPSMEMECWDGWVGRIRYLIIRNGARGRAGPGRWSDLIAPKPTTTS